MKRDSPCLVMRLRIQTLATVGLATFPPFSRRTRKRKRISEWMERNDCGGSGPGVLSKKAPTASPFCAARWWGPEVAHLAPGATGISLEYPDRRTDLVAPGVS